MTPQTEQELRELDCWIAECIFGWRPIIDAALGRVIWRGVNPMNGNLTACPSHWENGLPPHYSTDPAAAMAVLEKCAEKISTGSVEIYLGADEAPEYRRVWCVGYYETDSWIMAETLPIAICQFAKALFR